MRALVTDYKWPDLDIEKRILAGIGCDLVVAPDEGEKTLTTLARDADAILTCWAKTSRQVIAASDRLKVIVRYGVGLDNIDIAFATSRGIPVANVPDYCTTDVAEQTMALILSLVCKVAVFDRSIREESWKIEDGLPLRRLSGQTLGLVGFGKIAQQVACRALAFGMEVIAASPSLTSERAEAHGVECVDLDALLSRSDIVSLHCPSTETTRGMFDAARLEQFKPTAFLINTARGDLVDEAALADALTFGRLGGAALDVRVQEPPDAGDLLISMKNVIHTPHSAFYTTESLHNLQEQAAWEVRRVLTGEDPLNLVNPDFRQNN